MNDDPGKIPMDPETSFERRKFMVALGAASMAGLAGCGDSGDGSDGEGGDTTTTTTTAEDDDTTTTTEGIERYDSAEATWRIPRNPPLPSEAQYQFFAQNNPSFSGLARYTLLSRSYADLKFYGEIAKDWTYQPGVLDMQLHEDFYWWDGNNIDADTLVGSYDLLNFVHGGDANDNFERIVRLEKTGDYSVRFYLTDTFREEYALSQSITNLSPVGSLDYYQSWLEKFRSASTQKEVEEVRENLQNTTSKDPDPFYNNAFRVTGTGQDRWNFRLRTDEENTPHYVPEINFTNVEVIVGEDSRWKSMFNEQTLPWSSGQVPAAIDRDALGFETSIIHLVRPADVGAYTFNCEKPPMSNAHFRRAWMYMLNAQQHSTQTMQPEAAVTGFMTKNREQTYVSGDVLDGLTDYKAGQADPEKAEEEMQEGGFERDSSGNWLHKEGENAGEPMSFEIPSFSWMGDLRNNATGFVQSMNDFGIDVKHVGDTGGVWGKFANTEFDIGMTYWGGGFPAQTFAINFGTEAGFGAGNPLMPDTWEGPPVGQPDSDETETYQLTTATQRLKVTRNQEQYQRLVDRLTWAFNQTVPRAPIGAGRQSELLNTEKWNWPLPKSENAKYWTRIPFRRPYNTGGVAYVPPDQR